MKKSKWVSKDDYWGIRHTVREIFNKYKPFSGFENPIAFDIFYNQYVPFPWRESKKTVIRHLTEIKNILEGTDYKIDYVWTKRKTRDSSHDKIRDSVSCDIMNNDLYKKIENKEIELPTYNEIEEEKTRWQKTPTYNKEQGYSNPLKEEVIQFRVHKKKGVNIYDK